MKVLKILVVDDDPVIRRLLQERLTNEQYQVVVAEDGHEAKALLEQSHYDVVVTDLVMPRGIGGIEVLEISKELHPETEVLLITAHSSVDTAVAAMKKGAADYLEKPINFDELLLRLDKIANLKSILRNAQDIHQAMQVTEDQASTTIQDLEMSVTKMQDVLDKVEIILRDISESEDLRIFKALEILSQQ